MAWGGNLKPNGPADVGGIPPSCTVERTCVCVCVLATGPPPPPHSPFWCCVQWVGLDVERERRWTRRDPEIACR